MRLTTKLSAFVTLLITLAMVLMLVGCALSFFWLRSERVEKQVQSLMTEVDQALLTQSPTELKPWLQRMMPLMDIEQVQILEQQKVIL